MENESTHSHENGCAIEAAYVRPSIDRLTRDVNASHTQLREHGALIEKLLLWRDESSRRILLLEQAEAHRIEEARRVDKAIGEIKTDMQILRDHVHNGFVAMNERIDCIGSGIRTLIVRFDTHANEMKEENLSATKRHERLLRIGMTIASSLAAFASSLAALAVILISIHSQITGVPVIDIIKGILNP